MATRFYSSVEYGNARPSNDPDVLYFNATINNNNTEDPRAGTQDPQVSASYQRTYPLIQDASDFMISVVRMASNGATRNLPLLIPQIQESIVIGQQWLGSIQGAQMTISSTPTPTLSSGQTLTGSGTAILWDGSSIIGNIRYTIGLGSSGAPVQLTTPPPPGGLTWGINSTLANGFWPGGGGYPPGLYPVKALVNGAFFIGIAQQDEDLSVYSFTIEPVATPPPSPLPTAQVFVEWETQEPSVIPPSSPVITQDLGNEYYYCYSYDWWVYLCNKALRQAWLNAGSPGTSGLPPVLSYFTSPSGAILFSITPGDNGMGGKDWISPGAPGSPPLIDYKIYMNSNMVSLFSNFPGVYTNKDTGRTFEVYYSTNYLGTTGQIPLDNASYQEFPSTSSWSPVDALVLTTSQLPIVAEQTTPPSLVGASDTGFNRGVAEAAFQPILLDVSLRDLVGPEDWRRNFTFEPTGEYRMVTLTAQSSPISAIDILAWWRNRLDDNLYPLRLTNGSSLSLKIMFRRKQMGV